MVSKRCRPYIASYVDPAQTLDSHGREIFEGCPSKSWTFVITRDCVQEIYEIYMMSSSTSR